MGLGSQSTPNICLQVRKPTALLPLAVISCLLSPVLAELRQEGMVSYGTVGAEQTHQRSGSGLLPLCYTLGGASGYSLALK